MAAPLAQMPEQEAVDRAEGEFAVLSALSCALHILKNPVYLAGREVGVDEKAGLVLYCFFQLPSF